MMSTLLLLTNNSTKPHYYCGSKNINLVSKFSSLKFRINLFLDVDGSKFPKNMETFDYFDFL